MKRQYFDGPNLVIAECERCGRGFLSLREGLDMATARDPFAPAGRKSFQSAKCDGRIILLAPLESSATPEGSQAESAHDRSSSSSEGR